MVLAMKKVVLIGRFVAVKKMFARKKELKEDLKMK